MDPVLLMKSAYEVRTDGVENALSILKHTFDRGLNEIFEPVQVCTVSVV